MYGPDKGTIEALVVLAAIGVILGIPVLLFGAGWLLWCLFRGIGLVTGWWT